MFSQVFLWVSEFISDSEGLMSLCLLVVKTIDAMNTHVDLSPSWQVKFGRIKGMGPEKDMVQEKKAWGWKKRAWRLEKGAWRSAMLKGAGGNTIVI